MLAYKAFEPGLICRGYPFHMGLNVTDKANCAKNGFHCAENPLDCFSYYPDFRKAVYYIVDAGGDVDEDNRDSKISCTELRIIKRLSLKEFLLHALAYMERYPTREWNTHVEQDLANAHNGYAIVRGKEPLACGKTGDILALAKESTDGSKIVQMALAVIDGKSLLPGVWYDIDFKERV